jgi:hypothetical protein
MWCPAGECRDATAPINANMEATMRPSWDVDAPSGIVNRNASPVSAMVGTCQCSVSIATGDR